jgi:hypothetical protein
VRRGGTVIRRPGGGARTVVAQRGNRTVVARGARRGYIQRNVAVGGRNYAQRTYYAHGHAYVRAYRPVFYHGVMLHFYAPLGYYPIGLYGWALDPWGVPVSYGWGWAGAPWFAYYGGYYQPWNAYPAPAFWLTDYLISNTLQAAFQAREEAREADAAVDPDSTTAEAPQTSQAMPDDVKNMIEAEVGRQLAEARDEAQEAQAPQQSAEVVPPSLTQTGAHLFVAADTIEVQNVATREACVIGAGDAIQLNGGLPPSGDEIHVLVRASRSSDCPVNATVSLALPDLVEMHNNMRETVERGLEALREGQGTGNLPRLPEEAAGESRPTAFAASIQPDADVASVIADESSQADRIEREVTAEYQAAPSAESAGAAPPVDTREAGLMASIHSGQTESQVVAILGQPLHVSFAGGLRKVYQYASGKITFTDGDVSDVEASAASLSPSGTLAGTPAASARPRTAVAAGMTEAQVVAALGKPLRVSFLGGLRKIYEYADCKIVFTDGDVSEVQ